METRKIFTVLIVVLLAVVVCSSYVEQDKTATSTDTTRYPVFLFISDVHLNAFDMATLKGEDTGLDLWEKFLAKVDSVIIASKPDFIIYTGDLPAHYSCEDGCYIPPAKRDTHNTNLRVILEGFRSLADNHDLPLFYLPGNNDALAGDYYSFADEQQETPLSLASEKTNPFPALYMKSGNVAPCMLDNPHPTMGYYSALPVKGLRLIALNTVMFSQRFKTVDNTTPDADRATEMGWLAQQLKDASSKGEKVYIAMHIPPGLDAFGGNDMWHGSLCDEFLTLTMQYQSTIAGILYGHTHMDEVRRLYDTTGTKITEVAISCPGITPLFGNNPGFKLVQYDSASKEVMDFTTYYTITADKYWGTASYAFSTTYGATKNNTLFETISKMPLTKVDSCMSTIFTVKSKPAGHNSTRGIEVKMGM